MIKLCDFISDFENKLNEEIIGNTVVHDAMRYAISSGGKRLRPYAAYLGACFACKRELTQIEYAKVLDYAVSVEMVHTYSLIHDDLPCMDNDDFRRGKKTVHKAYNEWVAVLAGDALLNSAFEREKKEKYSFEKNPYTFLAKRSGLSGMLGGQVMDLSGCRTLEELIEMFKLKTSALFEAAFVGGALILQANEDVVGSLSEYAINLGIAFQIADDLLEEKVEEQNVKNYVSCDEAKNLLKQYTQKAENCIKYNEAGKVLIDFAEMLLNRKK